MLRACATFAMILLVGCDAGRPQTPKEKAIGAAYVGPTTLSLRKDLGPRAATTATAKHGDRLEVLEVRRRFVRVRTGQGIEGWTDTNALLTQGQVDDLDRLAATAAKLPVQAAATVYDSLNVHIAPSRQAPSFMQIPEGGKIEVVAHRLTPRVTPIQPAVKPVKSSSKKAAPTKGKGKSSKKEPSALPAPPPPRPPADLVDLSRPRISDLPDYVAPDPKSVAMDDWYLVRTRDGKAGWVLARQVLMSIPDEVAQYAEGHAITAYLPLQQVSDKDTGVEKPNWLWGTSAVKQSGYDFDSFRVFVWSIKHHRYETAYIERNVKGFYPLEMHDIPSGDGKAFSLVLEDKDGQKYKRTYQFNGYRVQMTAKVPYQEPPPLPEIRPAGSFEETPAQVTSVGWKDKIAGWSKRVFKKSSTPQGPGE